MINHSKAIYPLPNEISCESGDSISLRVFRNSLRIWFDISTVVPNDSEDSNTLAFKRFKCDDDLKENETSGDRGGIQQTNNDEDDDCDEYLPSGCRCGWHLLCDSDRLSALNDRDRIG